MNTTLIKKAPLPEERTVFTLIKKTLAEEVLQAYGEKMWPYREGIPAVAPVPREDWGNAYLWDYKPKPAEAWDAADRAAFTEGQALRIARYGLHTYGGYQGFFRPDLIEVIHLIHTVIPQTQLPHIARIYVTTEPYPSDDIATCYDMHLDRHRAVTTALVVLKSTVTPEVTDAQERKRPRSAAAAEIEVRPQRGIGTNAMTGEIMLPEDCTCRGRGTCLAYCNPYK